MREVTAIDPKWLVEFAPAFFKFGDPTKLSKRKKQERIEPLYNRCPHNPSVIITYYCMCCVCVDTKRLILGEYQSRKSGNKMLHSLYLFIKIIIITVLLLGQAKLIHCLSSGVFEKYMRAGGHFSYFIKYNSYYQLIIYQ